MQPPSPQPTPSGGVFPAAPEIIFTNRREALHRTGLSPAMKSVYALALSGYLDYCSRNGVSVTTPSARGELGEVERAKRPERLPC